MSLLSPHQIGKLREAIRGVKARLLAIDPTMSEDQQLWTDMIEGESNVLGGLSTLIEAALEAEQMAAACRARRQEIAERMARYEARAATIRRIIFDAMSEGDIRTIEQPGYTAGLRWGQARPVVIDADRLPAACVRRTVREPDLRLIGNLLKQGEDVPGATLSNPEQTLSIYVR